MNNPPQAIGIILDGNRRWARARGLPTLAGHERGLDKAKEIARAVFDEGISTLYYYAFSTENWNRAPEEVSYLMALFEEAIKNEFREIAEGGACIRFIGDRERLSESLRELAGELEEKTKTNRRGTLVIALSYGGRSEIIHAANKLIREGREMITEEDLCESLWTHDLPDPDIIIRTGGEQRLSNFLAWQSVYSELFFTPTLWPDFSEEELKNILEEYAQRERRHGK